ncbi:hypothetical protein Q3G72_030434 [Acer saccharum]|nr:hypothetical protein Q3G72_030434 [Acer saccharum]
MEVFLRFFLQASLLVSYLLCSCLENTYAKEPGEDQHPHSHIVSVQDPPVGQQNNAEVQDPPVGIQNSPNVQDPPLMAQQTSKVQDPPVNCRPVRLRKRGWQQTTPYTDPCKPKRAKSASHKFKPDEKVDAEVLADYVAFKEEPNGRRDVDIQLIVDVPWFVQFESNNSFLEDTV